MSDVEQAVDAIRRGDAVVLPTDTVYGICVDAYREAPARQLSRIKQRPQTMPIAVLAADLDAIVDAVPELRGRAETVARALLPGPYTLVVPNPARRLPWLTGARPDTIGIRVPDLRQAAKAVVEAVGAVAATSANAHGEPDPRRVDDISEEISAAVAVIVDGGELPGTPSTVIDLTGPEPAILREGAVAADEAAMRIGEAIR